MMEFEPFPKVPRLSRKCVVTEKIDGTNASVWITEQPGLRADPDNLESPVEDLGIFRALHEGVMYTLRAASRKRFIKPGDDNFGFAAWVRDNKDDLVRLGHGAHFGEWWGRGIQRGYGIDHKRFSLFNTGRWVSDGVRVATEARGQNYSTELVPGKQYAPACCDVVPVLAEGVFDEMIFPLVLESLRRDGSRAAPGFMRPEGIMIYHEAARQIFKKTLEQDEGKG